VARCSKENGVSAREAAEVYNVAPSTITRRLNHSVRSAKSVHQSLQRLSPTEEELIVKKAIQYYESGRPLRLRHPYEFANEFLTTKDPEAPEIGRHWHRKLLARHSSIKRLISRPSNPVRAAPVSRKDTLEEFFELYRDLRKTHGITSTDVYNIDEKGFMLGVVQRSHVPIPVQEKRTYMCQDRGREWVSVLECISATGEALPAWVVFKAFDQQHSWLTHLSTGKSIFGTSEKGWTDSGLGLNWLQEHFHPFTEKRRHGDFRMLILDGHESYCTFEFIDFCANNKIIPLLLPPNHIHLAQPLDVVFHQPLAKAYSILLDDHNQFCGKSPTKDDFIRYYEAARQEAVSSTNIMSEESRSVSV